LLQSSSVGGIFNSNSQFTSAYSTLTNHGQKLQTIADGERVCQLMVERVEPVNLVEVEELPDVDSQRNGGFGSTGRV
jgi:dUTP pyrophosphatase